jgi:hypothetical protein
LKAFEDSDDESSKKPEQVVEKSQNVEVVQETDVAEVISEPLFATQDLLKTTNVDASQDDLFASPAASDPRTYDDIFSTQPCKIRSGL